jgi:benzylsuccinate CoA-transferase BbsF subunit
MRHALEGLRVLDFCWVGAGALVTKLLAEHGAEVIKIESRARPDNLRVAPPFRPGVDGLDSSGYFASRNNDKRSFALNMRKPESREFARELALCSDLVTNNFRPGVMERWGLDYETLSAENPGVIYLSMPMNGSSGPDSQAIGFGSTIAAQAGLVYLSGRPDRDPIGTGTHYPDHVPSPGHALAALLAVILQRKKTGRGRLIELSQFESTVNLLGPAVVAASTGAPKAMRNGNRAATHSPSGVFRCEGDDAWIALAARNDAEWRALAETLGVPELADDERFTTLAMRKHNEDALELLLAALVAPRERWELARALQARGVPAWPALSSEDMLADEQLRARAFWRKLDHAVMGELSAPSAPFKGRGPRTGPERAAPLLGEHTNEIGRSLLGLDDAEIERLRGEEVLW